MKTYKLIEEWSSDGIHTERSGTTGGLHSLVQASESSKGEGVVGDGTHDPVSEGLVHGIAEVVEEVEGTLIMVSRVAVVDLGDRGVTGEVDLPGEGARPDGDNSDGDDTKTEEATSAALEALAIKDEETDEESTENGTGTFEGSVEGTYG